MEAGTLGTVRLAILIKVTVNECVGLWVAT